ncbi:response regulator transcription factor [Streptomyces sp. HC44]|uniref:Response regulator transcription factor n=1 Tax=Streptomyces scabichelini TaxID=2711217 RepID=A0A6G4UXK8_9ACTN|nr:response regulator transcription factor [Streptomyces scabichelini]NGO06491.1 response regulator transcription factor [Streptomyces scabichelini]
MSGAERAPRVLVADDQTLIRTGFRLILTTRGIEVVGEAADGAEAVAAARELRPDVVLMDIRMPNMDGLEAARLILQQAPECRVVMLTTFDLDRYVYEALALGASGFLLKDVTPEHLAAAVRLVDTGDALLAPSITRRLVERFAAPGRQESGRQECGAGGERRPGASLGRSAEPVPPHRDLTPLTPRELEVLTLLGRGLSNAELAAKLTLSEATVKSHVARIFAKLTLRDRAQAVVLAYETGLVSPGDST